MSEYSNRRDRGRLVGMVFSMQALGLIVGPLVALVLLSLRGYPGSQLEVVARPRRDPGGHGHLPAGKDARVAQVPSARAGEGERAARQAGRVLRGRSRYLRRVRRGRASHGSPRVRDQSPMLLLLFGTAGTWFLFDYAYYGNTLSLPAILKGVDAHATLEAKLVLDPRDLSSYSPYQAMPWRSCAWTGSATNALQLVGFTVMAVAFLALGAIPRLTATVVPFLLVFGLSYFFVNSGRTPRHLSCRQKYFPVSMRTTGHGIAAGVGKLGAFIGVFLVPQAATRSMPAGRCVVGNCGTRNTPMKHRACRLPAAIPCPVVRMLTGNTSDGRTNVVVFGPNSTKK